MRRFLLVLATCFLVFTGAPNAVATAEPSPLDHLPALKGDYFVLPSKETGTTYHIFVRLPEGYAENPQKKYPVVYLLDGDSLFPLLAPTHLFLTYDDKVPEAIIVGIAYGSFEPAINKRDIDFSATSNKVERLAGAPRFLKFLKSELLPAIERRFSADPAQRILLGQSRAGYFALYSAFADPALFRARIASNPAMRAGEEKFLQTNSVTPAADSVLILSSGTKDRDELRQTAQKLGARFTAEKASLPWEFRFLNVQDGTHAADIGRVYRAAMQTLFQPSTVNAD